MNDTPQNPPQVEPPQNASGAGWFILNTLASLKFALTLVLLIALVCVAGTLLPQGDQVGQYLAHNPGAKGRMEVLEKLGLTHVFSSTWFLGLLGVLSASLIVCTYRRCRAIRSAPRHKRLRVIGSVVTHVSLLTILAGAVVGVLWGEKGAIAFREGETATYFQGRQGAMPLPFAVRLVKFELELHPSKAPAPPQAAADQLLVMWPDQGITNVFPVKIGDEYVLAADAASAQQPDAYRLVITRYEPDFKVDTTTRSVASRTDQPNNPAILVSVRSGGQTNEQWLFAKFADFNMHGDREAAPLPFQMRFVSASPSTVPRMGDIKSFKSSLELIQAGKVVRAKTIAVNSPLTYGGYTLYQTGYDPQDRRWTSLQVVKDPGVSLVYTGFMLMMVGLVIVFWVQPSIEARPREPGDAL